MSGSTWDFMPSTGWFATAATERALEFAVGDNDRLVSAALARFLTDRMIEFEWSADDATAFKVGGYFELTVKACLPDSEGQVTFDESLTDWTLYGAVPMPGVVVLMGLTYRDSPVNTLEMLSITEWLKGVGEGAPHPDIADQLKGIAHAA